LRKGKEMQGEEGGGPGGGAGLNVNRLQTGGILRDLSSRWLGKKTTQKGKRRRGKPGEKELKPRAGKHQTPRKGSKTVRN